MRILRKTTSCFLFLFLSSASMQAQTTLAAGDIAIIGYNYDASPQEMSIVTLVPILSNTRIFISDYGYEAGAFVSNTLANNVEGSIEWLTTSDILAGTVFRIQMASSNAGTTVTGLPGTLTIRGWKQEFNANAVLATNCPAPAGGENWFIYQGTSYSQPTQFVFGWANWAATTFGTANGWLVSPQTVGTNIQVSYLPAQLTNGINARSLAWLTGNGGMHGDNNVYTGIQTGTKAQLIAAISDLSNWSTNETTTYDISVGGSFFSGSNPVFTVQSSTLPVTWQQINAVVNNRQVNIYWTTLTEPGNREFTIEHSIDNQSWQSLHHLPAGGNETSGGQYQYTHSTPAHGINYYRIRQTDLDGRFSYSRIVKVNVPADNTVFSLFPNPAQGMVTIEKQTTDPAMLTIYNMSGIAVSVQKLQVSRTSLDLRHLPAGQYLFQIKYGMQKENIRLLLQ
ncbi:MAG: T9SS type A sorting domain-containing protein [Sphingobacteriales bacterium]|nr:T9SS type A sorting domain-containing protein [Sphingobacteriales bacterium]OJW30109.1 MAG: hypothetical protein BGO54_00495 [Sphingobacteriales bacterium 46-32]